MNQITEKFANPNLAEMVELYAKFGFQIFPVHSMINGACTCGNIQCKSPAKHPITKNGFKDSIPAQSVELVRKLFNKGTENIAIRTGVESNIFVIDVDGEEGQQSLNLLEQQFGRLPETLTFLTARGKHLVFSHPGLSVKSTQSKLGQNIDIRGDGGYIVAPPSLHASGKQYLVDQNRPLKVVAAPSWLIGLLTEESTHFNKSSFTAWPIQEVEKMLQFLDPSCGYDDWVKIGMALHHGGYAYSLWDQWSAGSFKYKSGCCAPHWKSFHASGNNITMGTVVEWAKRSGWRSNSESNARITTNMEIRLPTVPLLKITPKDSFGFDPLKLPGLIGDTVRWIEKYALFSQPELALIATLTFAGAVFGRRYSSPIDGRTNIYMVGIAGTGSGKDHPRKMISRLVYAAKIGQFIGPNKLRSDTGLLRGLSNNSSMVCMIDEFGMFLAALNDKKAAPHNKLISSAMMELYSTANGIYNHGDYADPRVKAIIINNPNLCVYGTATEATYATALRKTSIESGDINRFIVTKSTMLVPQPHFDIPIMDFENHKDLVDAWAKFEPKSIGEMINTSNIKPAICIIDWGACNKIQQDLLLEQCSRVTGPLGALWARLYENTIKIAMIFAIARNHINPVFYPEDFEYASHIVRNAIRYMESLANDHMFDSETEADKLEILRYIKEQGGEVTKSELTKKMQRLRRYDLENIMIQLAESDQVWTYTVPAMRPQGGGNGTTYYKLL